jgi:hypothetical protein
VNRLDEMIRASPPTFSSPSRKPSSRNTSTGNGKLPIPATPLLL